MSNRFDTLATPIAGLQLLQRKPVSDQRGYLERLYCADELHTLLAGKTIIQINHTVTMNKGTVRGLHYQHPPHAETKFVSCLRGEVFDIALDLRNASPTFLQAHAEILSAANHKTFVIPEGFAHGFQALTDNCEMLYFHTASYHPEAERGLNVIDPRLGIPWPLPVSGLSARDAGHPLLDADFAGLAL